MEQLRERLRVRWCLWVAVLRLWRSELWVRVSLARWCLAIYRRELLEHKYETARMEADAWRDEAETFGNDSHELGDLLPRSLEEDCMTEGVRGIPWRIWGRLSVISWLLLIPAAWAGVFLAWLDLQVLSLGTFGLWLGFAAWSNGVPGVAALLHLRDEGRLLSQPEAAALSALTLSAASGLLTGFLATCLHMQMGVWIALSGIAFGILYLPLSFGLIFPLAIPLACGFTIWAVARTRGRISRMGYAVLTGVSAIGWLGVALIGPIFGLGG